jgi:hypothetical protein
MSDFRRRSSYSFAIGLALSLICFLYLPHWKTYAPDLNESAPAAPYLNPWTVLFVAVLSLSLAINTIPLKTVLPLQPIFSKGLAVCVICVSTVFFLEYLSGIRVPDLNLFLLHDSSGQQLGLYSERPTPIMAATSLLFACSLLLYDPESIWCLHAFQFGTVSALVPPALAALAHAGRFFLAVRHNFWFTGSFSIPAIILYLSLGSGFFGLFHRPRLMPAVVAADRPVRRRV